MSLLNKINIPSDLRNLNESELPLVAEEIRKYIIQTLNKCGGHFGANLGAVELTLALHYLYNAPHDQIIWDVGHQAYVHKILTNRKHLLATIRQQSGLAPFPTRTESKYDSFGVGHSSTSISAALGMSLANRLQGKKDKMIAVIGDGAMTAGMAFEALNHAGDTKADLLVILNDNDMSISGNVGALSNYVARILSGKLYLTMRNGSKKVLSLMPSVWEFARKTETHIKGMVVPGTLFEELGFNYIGPIDGHCLPTLLKTIKNIQNLKGPQFLHIVTQKGKGFKEAEKDPIKYHAVKPRFLDKLNSAAKEVSLKKSSPTYSEVFGKWLCDMATQDDSLVAITPAMKEGSCLVEFAMQFPTKYFDVGIAEQHSVTLAAGLACQGIKPVVAIYSSFLQRAYDQLIHDVALQNLNVLFALDRAGIVGGDGATHNGAFDISFLSCIPNMVIMAPANENELRQMLYTGYNHKGPVAVRYPRGKGPGAVLQTQMQNMKIGKADVLRKGKNIAILSFGSMVENCVHAAEELDATLVNMRFIKPLDEELIANIAKSHTYIVTVEENVIIGGAGQQVSHYLHQQQLGTKLLNLGLPDQFVEHGTPEILLQQLGLNPKGILSKIMNHFSHILQGAIL